MASDNSRNCPKGNLIDILILICRPGYSALFQDNIFVLENSPGVSTEYSLSSFR